MVILVYELDKIFFYVNIIILNKNIGLKMNKLKITLFIVIFVLSICITGLTMISFIQISENILLMQSIKNIGY